MSTPTPVTKCCTRCQRDLPLSAFHRDGTMADGLERRCKTCRKEVAAARYERNREKILEKCREYFEANRAECMARNAEWTAAHPEQVRAHLKKYTATLTAEQRQQINARRRQRYAARKATQQGEQS